jgi:hypothetical protein
MCHRVREGIRDHPPFEIPERAVDPELHIGATMLIRVVETSRALGLTERVNRLPCSIFSRQSGALAQRIKYATVMEILFGADSHVPWRVAVDGVC